MRVTFTKEAILPAVQLADDIVPAKGPDSLLSNLLVKTDKNRLVITSTDLTTAAIITIPAQVYQEGGVITNAKKFSAVIRELPNDDIHFELTPNNLIKIRSKNEQIKICYTLQTKPQTEYPVIPPIEFEHSISMPQNVLKDMIRRTIFAVSTDETKYILTGVCFEIFPDCLNFVTSDSRRLAFISHKIITDTEKTSIIVATRPLLELMKFLGTEGSCNIAFSQNHIFFQFNNINIISRLIEGEFPNYKEVLPTSFPRSVRLYTQQFLNALNRVALMAEERYNKIIFSFTKDKLTLKAITPELGEAIEEVDVAYDDEHLEIAFNCKFLIEIVNVMRNSEQIIMEFSNPLSPISMKEEGNLDYYCIVMPMRLA